MGWTVEANSVLLINVGVMIELVKASLVSAPDPTSPSVWVTVILEAIYTLDERRLKQVRGRGVR